MPLWQTLIGASTTLLGPSYVYENKILSTQSPAYRISLCRQTQKANDVAVCHILIVVLLLSNWVNVRYVERVGGVE